MKTSTIAGFLESAQIYDREKGKVKENLENMKLRQLRVGCKIGFYQRLGKEYQF